jgi:hypothetical protein
MKQVILLCALSLLFGCTKSKTDTAKTLIEEHLTKILHDKSSYESVEFGNLDSTFTNYTTDSLYRHYLTKRVICQKMRNKLYDESQIWRTIDKERHDFCEQRALLYADSTSLYKDLEDKAKQNFAPQFNGYVMKHSFRSKNQMGNTVLNVLAFQFDTELTRVTSACDWNEYTNNSDETAVNDLVNEMLEE